MFGDDIVLPEGCADCTLSSPPITRTQSVLWMASPPSAKSPVLSVGQGSCIYLYAGTLFYSESSPRSMIGLPKPPFEMNWHRTGPANRFFMRASSGAIFSTTTLSWRGWADAFPWPRTSTTTSSFEDRQPDKHEEDRRAHLLRGRHGDDRPVAPRK